MGKSARALPQENKFFMRIRYEGPSRHSTVPDARGPEGSCVPAAIVARQTEGSRWAPSRSAGRARERRSFGRRPDRVRAGIARRLPRNAKRTWLLFSPLREERAGGAGGGGGPLSARSIPLRAEVLLSFAPSTTRKSRPRIAPGRLSSSAHRWDHALSRWRSSRCGGSTGPGGSSAGFSGSWVTSACSATALGNMSDAITDAASTPATIPSDSGVGTW